MPARPVRSRRSIGIALLLASCVAGGLVLAPAVTRGQAGGTASAAAGSGAAPVVPPVPDGTPAELFRFVEGLFRPARQPESQEEMAAYLRAVGVAAVQAADKILVQTRPADAEYVEAARLKLASLGSLVKMGDEQAPRLLAAFAATLATGPDAGLAAQARRATISSEADAMFASGKLDAGPALIEKLVAEVSANPDDPEVAELAMRFATDCEQAPDGGPLARTTYEKVGPLLAASRQPGLKRLGEVFAGAIRRLALPGKPMAIQGTLLDGSRFDPATLAGKVVLVDFWATWCGPCLEEIPNIRQHYEKYHARGFEVVGVSLDDDRDAVVQVVQRAGMPWPILFDASGAGGHPLALQYGVALIPRMILIGRDGNVITIDAMGERLGAELAKAFPNAD